MQALKFRLKGKHAFFKIPAVNSYYYFTYAQIHKVALLGIFGAILGYDGYQQMQKEDRFPEFYERLQALKVSVIPCVKNGIFLKKVQTFNNSIGSLEQGGNLIVQEQWLEKPEWLIYVLLDCEESEKLAEMLEKKQSIYIPYLGKNDHSADILEVERVEVETTDPAGQRIDSLFPEESFLMDELEADFRKGLFSGNFHLSYQYQHRPIMEETIRDKNNSFVRTNANQLSWQKLNPELELKLGPLKDILTFSFSTGINYYDSRGLDYHHTYTNWYYRAEVMASYKRWSGFFQMENHRNNFYGETLSYGESFHTLGLSYRYKRLNIGMMTLNPFVDNYRMGGEMFSKVAPSKNWWYVKESCRLFVAKVSWNISFGRKYETMQKRVNNEDSNAGTLKSGK